MLKKKGGALSDYGEALYESAEELNPELNQPEPEPVHIPSEQEIMENVYAFLGNFYAEDHIINAFNQRNVERLISNKIDRLLNDNKFKNIVFTASGIETPPHATKQDVADFFYDLPLDIKNGIAKYMTRKKSTFVKELDEQDAMERAERDYSKHHQFKEKMRALRERNDMGLEEAEKRYYDERRQQEIDELATQFGF